MIRIFPLQSWAATLDWQLTLAHDLPLHRVIWASRGQATVLHDGARKGLGTNTALFIPAGSLFAMSLPRQATGYAMTIPADLALRLPKTPAILRICDMHAQSELTRLLDAAFREAQDARPLIHDALEAHGALVSVWLRRQLALDDHAPAPPGTAQRLTGHFCQIVSTGFASAPSVADIASRLGITATHLTRVTRKTLGKTPHSILAERSLWEARTMLRDTDAPVKNIARHLGFATAPYFSRFIQTHCGLPPGKLRLRDRNMSVSAGQDVANKPPNAEMRR